MSDIFREVEEDVRRERLERFWKAYGAYVIAGIVVILAAVGAWQLWQRHEDSVHARQSDAFVAAQRISDPAQAATAFANLASQSSGGYVLVTKLAQANALYASGQVQPALDLWKQVAADKSSLGSVARLRAGWALADRNRAQAAEMVAPLDVAGSAWRPAAQEILAYADYRGSNFKQAQIEFNALATDAQAPDALRNRAKAMAAFLANGAGADFGTVPPPPAPPALPAPTLPTAAATPPAAPAK